MVSKQLNSKNSQCETKLNFGEMDCSISWRKKLQQIAHETHRLKLCDEKSCSYDFISV